MRSGGTFQRPALRDWSFRASGRRRALPKRPGGPGGAHSLLNPAKSGGNYLQDLKCNNTGRTPHWGLPAPQVAGALMPARLVLPAAHGVENDPRLQRFHLLIIKK